ncbi:MAG: class I SAM-dependent methyltransferase [Alphaproteobacteria bacterium]|nr:class I SAM-dependent methyltransferase [Alphaproteobacteria bacterium]
MPVGLWPDGHIGSVLDVGCGLSFKTQYIKADIRVGVDAYRPYLEKIDATVPYVCINADAQQIDSLFLHKSFDIVALLDIVEHLEKSDALELIEQAGELARRAVVIETPLCILPQNMDILGLGGDHYQTHRCGFEAEELEAMGYEIVIRTYELANVKRHTSESSPVTIKMMDAIKRYDRD